MVLMRQGEASSLVKPVSIGQGDLPGLLAGGQGPVGLQTAIGQGCDGEWLRPLGMFGIELQAAVVNGLVGLEDEAHR